MVDRPSAVAEAVATRHEGARQTPRLDAASAERVQAVARTVDAAARPGADHGAGDGSGTGDGPGAGDGYDRPLDLEEAFIELCAFQSRRLAHQYLDFVEGAAAADAERGDGSGRLTVAAARGYFKLLAYKDEYEVARLMLDPAANAEARELAAATGARRAWKLHPPVLRALGMKSKIAVPVSWTPLFRALVAMRRLRGTILDPFGHSAVRRAERSLPKEYRAAVESDLRRLSPDRYPAALSRAALAEEVRGYEQIKMDSIARVREELNAGY